MVTFLPRCMECRRGIAMRKLFWLYVCPTVFPSVGQTRGLWQNGRKICPDFYTIYERLFRLVFWEEEWLVRATPSTWNFWSTGPRWSEIADFQPIFARSVSAITPSEKKVQLTLIGSPLRAFQIWSLYVAPRPPKGGSKTQNGRFTSKIALRVKKVC